MYQLREQLQFFSLITCSYYFQGYGRDFSDVKFDINSVRSLSLLLGIRKYIGTHILYLIDYYNRWKLSRYEYLFGPDTAITGQRTGTLYSIYYDY